MVGRPTAAKIKQYRSQVVPKRKCSKCKEEKPHSDYTDRQLKKATEAKCMDCCDKANAPKKNAPPPASQSPSSGKDKSAVGAGPMDVDGRQPSAPTENTVGSEVDGGNGVGQDNNGTSTGASTAVATTTAATATATTTATTRQLRPRSRRQGTGRATGGRPDSNKFVMGFTVMETGAKHSHRMNSPNKPKEYLPPRDMPHIRGYVELKADLPRLYDMINLDLIPHFSMPGDAAKDVVATVRANRIPVSTVDVSQKGADGKVRSPFGLSVAYPGSDAMNLIQTKATGFEDDLLTGLIELHMNGKMERDNTRQMELDNTRLKSFQSFRLAVAGKRIQARLRLGFGQGQPKTSSAYRQYRGVPTPSLKAGAFNDLGDELKKKLCCVFHAAAEEVKKEDPDAFDDDLRGKVFGDMLRKELKLGCYDEYPSFPWEYVDVLVTSGTGLARHCDHLNDNRKGYNHCSVYSYGRVIGGDEYKVSIIMTTRKSVGRATERIKEAGV